MRLRQGQVLPQERRLPRHHRHREADVHQPQSRRTRKSLGRMARNRPPMRQRYARFVDLSNQVAREIGFKDTGALWRAGYDMTPEGFSGDLERLWNQVKPLYLSLDTYVRWKLAEKCGPNVVPPDGPIPAHLLGNPWAQEWGNVYDLLSKRGQRWSRRSRAAAEEETRSQRLGEIRGSHKPATTFPNCSSRRSTAWPFSPSA